MSIVKPIPSAVILLALILVLSSMPLVAAQSASTRDVYGMQVTLDRTFAKVQYLQKANFTVTIKDISKDDAQGAPTASYLVHTVRIEDVYLEGNPAGWAISADDAQWNTVPGQTVQTTLRVTAGAAIRQPIVHANMSILLLGYDTVIRETVSFVVQVEEYYISLVLLKTVPPPQKQVKVVSLPVELTNLGLYPDKLFINVTVPSGWKASVPPQVILNPFETRTIFLDVQTPKRGIYEFGEIALVRVDVRSSKDPAAVYSRSTVVKVEGFYFSSYWEPLTIFAFLAAGLLITRGAERSRRREGEDGRPRPVELTPRQRVLLAELKRRDPDAYKARMAQLAAIHRTRREKYRRDHRTRLKDERRLIREEKIETRELRAARKEEAVERKELEKTRQKRMRELEKARAKQMAALAVIRKKEDRIAEKERGKRMKVLAREQKKKSAQLAKLQKQAAKAERAEAKAEKRAARTSSNPFARFRKPARDESETPTDDTESRDS